MPFLIVLSILLLGRSFYILYVTRRGTRSSAIITWLAAVFVVGYWSWQIVDRVTAAETSAGTSCSSSCAPD
jgi:hypothetical protein